MSEIRKLGRYEIVSEIGKGAMGTVYRATDPSLSRTVAIKTINMSEDPAEMAEYEARFYQEARAAGGLNHTNIVTVYDIGNSGNIAYMAMELLAGRELKDLMAGGKKLPVEQAVDIAAQVAEGLAYAHEHGIVHRDIKPANIMIVRDGKAKITDFGIARMRQTELKTQTGIRLGSPRYMSPEQVVGKRAEPRSDIFSLGVILYEMLTGEAPFIGNDINSMMFKIVNVNPPAPSTRGGNIPAMLDFIVAKMLAKAPDDRYVEAAELARDLRACAKQLDSPAMRATATLPPTGSPHPRLDIDAAAEHAANTFPATRREDTETAEDVVSIGSATLGLSKGFDSLSATQRLAMQSGLIDSSGLTITGSNSQSPRLALSEPPAWTLKDKLIFFGALAASVVAGIAIVFA